MSIDWAQLRREQLGDDKQRVLPPKLSLPCLPKALTDFLRKAEDPDCSSAALARIIETDAALTCELLRYVNSASVGLRNRASSVQQALSLLGIRKAKLFLLTVGAKLGLAARESKLVNLRTFWNTNLERALLAKEVARLLKADQDLAFAAGMLQDFLLPVLSNEMVGAYLEFLGGQNTRPVELAQFERSRHGWDHALASGALMRDWGFPDDLICCVLHHHRGLEVLTHPQLGRSALAASSVAALLPDAWLQVPTGFDQLQKLGRVWSEFDLVKIAGRIADEFAATSPGANHTLSLTRHLEKKSAAISA